MMLLATHGGTQGLKPSRRYGLSWRGGSRGPMTKTGIVVKGYWPALACAYLAIDEVSLNPFWVRL